MAENIIKYSRRFTARKHSKALCSIYKIFTELITNSDESYNRLKKTGLNIGFSKDIKIYIDRKTRNIKVVDYAEGMGLKDIKNAFDKYGAIKSGAKRGHQGRGLYGQGLTDVLFLNPHFNSNLISIKDNKLYKYTFYYKGDEQIYSNKSSSKEELKEFRQKYNIKRNGTIIDFFLPEEINIPFFENLIKALESYYMLRFINNNIDRNITITELENNKKSVTKKIEYNFIEKLYSNDILKVIDKKIYFKYEDFKSVEAEVIIYKANFDLKQRIGEDANGILVFDSQYDNSVYDLDFFGFDKEKEANNIFGYIKLTNAREIIDKKLNKPIPDEILTDTRDGFLKNHSFYKHFSLKIKNLLSPFFDRLKEAEEDDSKESEETQRKHQEAFNYLNKRYIELVGKKEGGTFDNPSSSKINGLVFARENIKITIGKVYELQLKININDFPKNAKIYIDCNQKQILFSPKIILLSEEMSDKNGVVSKYIKIQSNIPDVFGKIIAKCENFETVCFISVLQTQLFYPKDGIEFNPNEVIAITNRKTKLYLYLDLKKVVEKEKIILFSENKIIQLLDDEIIIPKSKISDSYNAVVPITFVGKKKSETGYITARYKNYESKAKVYIYDKKDKPLNGKNAGIFRGWKFGNMPEQIQKGRAQFGENSGFIIINKKNPINKMYFGDSPIRSDIDKSIIMQLYIAELTLDEFLNLSVAEAYNRGNLGQQTDDPHTDISKHIAMEKLKIGPAIYNMFVNISLRKEFQDIINRKMNFNETNILMSRIGVLEGRLKEMVEMKFGLNENRKHTLEEIGLKYKLSRERVRQIINGALPKLYEDDEIVTIDDVIKEKLIVTKEGVAKIDKQKKEIDYITRFEESLNTTINKIIATVTGFYNIRIQDIKGSSRKKEFVVPRQVAMYLIRKHVKSSFSVIGEIFGRDHTTAIHAYNKVNEDYSKKERIKKEIMLVERNLANLK